VLPARPTISSRPFIHAAAQLTSEYVTANGIRLPTKRRAYTRGPDRRPVAEMLMVSIDISEVGFE
jgi:hypothetical protein